MISSQWAFEIIAVVIILIATYVYKRKNIYSLSWSLPGPFALPLIGNAFTFYCSDEDLFEKAVEVSFKYPSPLRFWFGLKFTIVFTDVIQAEKIMSSSKFACKDEIYKFIEEFDGLGLITASGPKWKRDRRLMSPLFLKKNIMQYFPYILEHTKILIKILDKHLEQPIFNIEPVIHRCTADFVNETIIGVKTKAQHGEMESFIKHLSRIYTVVHARMVKVWLQVDWIFKLSHYYREQEEGKENVFNFIRAVLKRNEENHACFGVNRNQFRTIIDQLLDIKDEVPDFANEQELIHHLVTLYSASEDTITSIASFTLVLLGMYPSIQDKVVEEILYVIGRREIEEGDLAKLEYLEMVLKEVLRLFPIAPFIARKASQDFQIDKWLIPEGCSIIVSIQNIHRDPKHWEKPNQFYPEHFLPEAIRKRHPYAFMPFSAGPRGCIGKPYANMALKIIVVTILQNYVLESEGKLEDKGLKMDISVRFKDGFYPLSIRKRQK